MIDFSMTEEQEALLEAADTFIARRVPPGEVLRRDEQKQPPYDLLPELAALGVLGLVFPQRYGGAQADWTTLALVQERLAYHAYFVSSIVSRAVSFGGMSLMTYGTEAQREAWLPELVAGRSFFALALTEPEAGSDAGAVSTRAVRSDRGWSITGLKTWISDADGASHLVVPARTERHSTGSRGLSVFLVPRDTPGVHLSAISKIGNNCMPCYEVALDDVEVPGDALMGEEGAGFDHVLSTLHYSRASLAASATGCARSAVDLAVRHARQREQFGRPIGKNQVVRHRLADMQMRVDQSTLTLRHLAWLIAQGRPSRRQAAQAKVIASETLQYVTHWGMQILASYGYTTESHMQRMWRDARLYSFGEGTNEIQRDLIAREMGL